MIRKRLFLLAIFSVIFPCFVMGQDNGFKAGVVGGPSLYWLRGEGIEPEYHNGLCYSAGLTLEKTYNNAISIESGLYYLNRKYYANSPKTLFSYANINNLEYYLLSIPLKIKYYFGKTKKIYFSTGIVISSLLSAKSIIYEYSGGQPFVSDDTEHYKRIQMKIPANFGFIVPLNGRTSIFFEIYDYLGLSNIKISPHPNQKTNSVSLSLGLAIGI